MHFYISITADDDDRVRELALVTPSETSVNNVIRAKNIDYFIRHDTGQARHLQTREDFKKMEDYADYTSIHWKIADNDEFADRFLKIICRVPLAVIHTNCVGEFAILAKMLERTSVSLPEDRVIHFVLHPLNPVATPPADWNPSYTYWSALIAMDQSTLPKYEITHFK